MGRLVFSSGLIPRLSARISRAVFPSCLPPYTTQAPCGFIMAANSVARPQNISSAVGPCPLTKGWYEVYGKVHLSSTGNLSVCWWSARCSNRTRSMTINGLSPVVLLWNRSHICLLVALSIAPSRRTMVIPPRLSPVIRFTICEAVFCPCKRTTLRGVIWLLYHILKKKSI